MHDSVPNDLTECLCVIRGVDLCCLVQRMGRYSFSSGRPHGCSPEWSDVLEDNSSIVQEFVATRSWGMMVPEQSAAPVVCREVQGVLCVCRRA